VATIFASVDGRKIITGRDLEALEPLAKYQMDIRSIYKPNAGVNPDAQYANDAKAWVEKHAHQWRTIRDLKRATQSLVDQLGPNVVERSLMALSRDGSIELWLHQCDRQGQPLPMPADYTGRRPLSGLVRKGRVDE